MITNKEIIKNIEKFKNFFNEDGETRLELYNSYKILKIKVINEMNSFKLYNKINYYKSFFILAKDDYEGKIKRIEIIKKLTNKNDKNISENDKEILINEFYPYIKDFFENLLKSDDISSIIIVLFRIYEFFPKDTRFTREEMPNILASLLKNKNLLLNKSIKNDISNIMVSLLNNKSLNDRLQSIIQIDSNNQNEFYMRFLLNNEYVDLGNKAQSIIQNNSNDLIKSTKNNVSNIITKNRITYLLKNKYIPLSSESQSNIKNMFLNIIKNLFKESFEGYHQGYLLNLILNNSDVFSDFIKYEIPDILRYLFYYDGFPQKDQLLEPIFKHRDILSDFIKYEIPNIIKDLLRNDLVFTSIKKDSLELVFRNKEFFLNNFIKIELINIIRNLDPNIIEKLFKSEYKNFQIIESLIKLEIEKIELEIIENKIESQKLEIENLENESEKNQRN